MIACLVVTAVGSSGSAFAQTAATTAEGIPPRIRAAVPAEFPPHYVLDADTGRMRGFAIDVAEALARRCGIDFEYIPCASWTEAIEALKSGEADVIPNLGDVPERHAFARFTAPVETFGIRLYVRHASRGIEGAGDLAGRKVGVVESNRAASFLREDHPEAGLRVCQSLDEAIMALLAGQVDAVAYPGPPMRRALREAGLDEKVRSVGEPLLEVRRAVAVRGDLPQLHRRLDAAVLELTRSEEYREIFARWYGEPEAPERLPLWLLGGFAALVAAALVAAFLLARRSRRLREELDETSGRAGRTEAALRNTAEMLRFAVESSDDVFAIYRRDGSFVDFYASPRMRPEDGDLQGRNVSEFFAPETAEEILRQIRRVFDTGETIQSEIPTRVNGDRAWVHVTRYPIRDEQGRTCAVGTIAHNITERKRAEDEIRALKDFYHQILEAIQSGLWVTDRDGVIRYTNPAMAKIAGMSVEEILGRNVLRDFSQKTIGELRTHFNTARQTLRPLYLRDLSVVTPDGRETLQESWLIPLVRQGRFEGVACLTNDVTERRHGEEAVARREAILEAVSLAATDLLTSADWSENIDTILARLGTAADVSRVYVFSNHSGEHGKLLFSQRHEWTAEGIEPFIDDPRLQGVCYDSDGFERWRRILQTGRTIFSNVRDMPESERDLLEFQGIRSIVVVPIYSGSLWWGLMGFDECRGEREWTSAELDALRIAASALGAAIQKGYTERILRQSIREKDTLLGEIHHRVKNNLQVVLSLLNLQSQALADPRDQGVFRECRERIKVIAKIHERLYRSDDLSRMDFADFAEALAADLRRTFGMDGAVKLDVRTDRPVLLDIEHAVPYGLLLNELACNAFKHAFEPGRGGTLGVYFKHLETDGHICVEVFDDGSGLPEDFDIKEGDTLGLRLVRSLCEQFNGEIELARDAGTRLTLTLPLPGSGDTS